MTKPGDTLYAILHEDDGTPTVERWIVRTVRGGKATAIWKLSHTWGKRSKKHGDFGWLDPIPAWCRRTWPLVSGNTPWGLYVSKAAAIKAEQEAGYTPDDFDNQEQFEKYTSMVARMRG